MSSSETWYDRWCVVPAIQRLEGDETVTAPVFAGDRDFAGWSGMVVPKSSLQAFYPLWLAKHPDTDLFFVIRIYAIGSAGYDALEKLADTDDCLVMDALSYSISTVLNTQLSDVIRSDADWERSLRIG